MKNVKKDKVWYAVYGTNLNENRFMCYVKGGAPEGTWKTDIGCRDKTAAIDGGMIFIPFQLYFTKNSSKWENKSVGFLGLKVNPVIKTLGRKYLISEEQFEDIFKQENNIDIKKAIKIDFGKAEEESTLIVKQSWYGRIVFLGEEGGLPIFTLTAYWDFNPKETLPPSSSYLRHIIKGIKQVYRFPNEQILEYLNQKPGVSMNFSKNELLDIIQES